MERSAIPVAMMAQTHWREADRDAFAAAWTAELADLPEFTDSRIHIVTGLLLPIWKRLPDEGCRVYRLQTDEGERVIGRLVSPAWVAQAIATDVPTICPADAWPAVLDGRTTLPLADGLPLPRAQVLGAFPVALSGFPPRTVHPLQTQ